MNAVYVARAMRAEGIRTGGRSRLWTVILPAAVMAPLAVTFGIAWLAESFAAIPGQLSVLQVSTSNAGYWVISLTVILVAVAAADGQASESRYQNAQYVRLAIPRQWPVLVGRWLFYGFLGALLAAVTMLAALVALPVLAPQVYGLVSSTDDVAVRLVWTVAVLAFFAAGAGIGLGALIRSPLGAASAILLWAYVIESAAGHLPRGAHLQRLMPILNGVYATGQDTVLTPPWGPNIALVLVCALSTAIFLVAAAERSIRHG